MTPLGLGRGVGDPRHRDGDGGDGAASSPSLAREDEGFKGCESCNLKKDKEITHSRNAVPKGFSLFKSSRLIYHENISLHLFSAVIFFFKK